MTQNYRSSQGFSINEGSTFQSPRTGPQSTTNGPHYVQPIIIGTQLPNSPTCSVTKVLQKLIHVTEGITFDTGIDSFCNRNKDMHGLLLKDVAKKREEIETYFNSLESVTGINKIDWEKYQSCTQALHYTEMYLFKLVNEYNKSVKTTSTLADKFTTSSNQWIQNGTLLRETLLKFYGMKLKGFSISSFTEADALRANASLLKELCGRFGQHFTKGSVLDFEGASDLSSALKDIQNNLGKRKPSVGFDAFDELFRAFAFMEMMIGEATQVSGHISDVELTCRKSLVQIKVLNFIKEVVVKASLLLSGGIVIAEFNLTFDGFKKIVTEEEQLPPNYPDMMPIIRKLGSIEEPYVARSFALTTICHELVKLCIAGGGFDQKVRDDVKDIFHLCATALEAGGKPVDRTKPGENEQIKDAFDKAVKNASECYRKLEKIANDGFAPTVLYDTSIQEEKELIAQWHKRLDIDPNFCTCD